MSVRPATNRYKRHRFPVEIISHCVWLYFRFCLSYRDVEELMAERGVMLTYEAVRAISAVSVPAFQRAMKRASASGVIGSAPQFTILL